MCNWWIIVKWNLIWPTSKSIRFKDSKLFLSISDLFKKEILKSIFFKEVTTLPPRAAAAKQHSYRVYHRYSNSLVLSHPRLKTWYTATMFWKLCEGVRGIWIRRQLLPQIKLYISNVQLSITHWTYLQP